MPCVWKSRDESSASGAIVRRGDGGTPLSAYALGGEASLALDTPFPGIRSKAKVEKGDGLKTGATLYVSCYQHDPNWLRGKNLTEKEKKQYGYRGSSYESVPKEGERIRAYAKQWGSKYSAIFPSWYESIKGK